jgi:hypothetical protein
MPQTTDNRQPKHRTKIQEPRLCSANLKFTAIFKPHASDNRQQITDNRQQITDNRQQTISIYHKSIE